MASLHVAPVGTPVGGSTTLNRYGPQSTRPLPRWYWYSVAQHRWRRFDNSGTGSSRNDALEKISEHTASGLQVNTRVSYSGGYIYIVEWDKANRRGQFKWKESATTSVRFERKSQREAAEIQANNFVYDHSGVADPSDRMLADNAHVVPMFRDMLHRELEHAKTHVFMYHSYHNVSLLYDLGACLMRVAFPDEVTDRNRDALVLRTDRSTFNARSVQAVKTNFQFWYSGTDVALFNPVGQLFPWIGVSMVLNCFKTNPESTVVHDFQKGYNPGDSPDLSPVLDDLLARFHITELKQPLLQLTIEADVDVTSFLGDGAHLFWRESAEADWERVAEPMAGEMLAELEDFMTHDNELGPQTATDAPHGWELTLQRDGPGMQAHGTATSTLTGQSRAVLAVTKNPGRYLQVGVPLELASKLAYAALPFGVPDPDPAHRLSQMDNRTDLSKGGQARVIARPDLLWRPDVLQKVYQFSRGAAAKRLDYLQKMEDLLRAHLGPIGVLKTQWLLRPPPIVVRSHNVQHDNPTPDAVVEHLTSAATYDVACLQEATSGMLGTVNALLPPEKRVLYATTCGSTNVYAAMIYRSDRFTLQGAPFYGCFKKKNGVLDNGRPVIGAVFYDRYVDRRVMVLSVHAPHSNYLFMPNLQYFVASTLKASGTTWKAVAHVVLGGDFNRDDWGTLPSLQAPHALRLRSAQGMLGPHQVTHAGVNKAIDNILFGSREFRYNLELAEFYAGKALGSDHRPVVAKLLC